MSSSDSDPEKKRNKSGQVMGEVFDGRDREAELPVQKYKSVSQCLVRDLFLLTSEVH